MIVYFIDTRRNIVVQSHVVPSHYGEGYFTLVGDDLRDESFRRWHLWPKEGVYGEATHADAFYKDEGNLARAYYKHCIEVMTSTGAVAQKARETVNDARQIMRENP